MSSLFRWLKLHYRQVTVVTLHVLAWVLYVAFYSLAYVQQSGNQNYRALFMLSILLTDLPLFYYYYLSAIPRLLVRKKVWRFILVTVFVSLAYPLARYGLDILFVNYFDDGVTPLTNIAVGDFNVVFGIRLLAALFVVAMAGIGKFTFDWFENQRIRRELENQNLSSELAFLKSQINPHFLFNTLNNIHTLAYKKSDDAPEAIMKLSDLMRYMIYESDVEFVPLEREIQHLKSFVTLQELRFKTKGIVTFEFEGDMSQKKIAPLVLLPFIENAFKHGFDLNKDAAIKVSLKSGDQLVYEVENPLTPSGMAVHKDQVGGIGLENIRRRLDIIYKDKHTLSVDESSNSFRIKLTIE
ncbi:sensor histidine kinase [Roseivirga sp. E12]|uniref:sensor histidine kinase n=1 Tax=Roseivirga sp. E12 TaxID=2819237 RepID=UPI001ABC5736|nr:sensor histidine kinase [Roseivirga sp. E12]MBO3700526.1 sensor histidine kinase [Roseivirga sp. E12]